MKQIKALWRVIKAHALFLWRVRLIRRCCLTCAVCMRRLLTGKPRYTVCKCSITRKWAPAHNLCKMYKREVPPCNMTEK